MSEIKASIIVPAYNDSERLHHLLTSFDSLEYDEPYEVIIVDDASTDRTPEVCHEWSKKWHSYKFRYIRLKQNSGPGIARNKGLEVADGEIVAFTDSDCRVHPHWLKKLISTLDPINKIVGVGGRVKAVSEASVFARHSLFHHVLEPPEKLHYLVTCNCSFIKKPLLDIGGFAEDIRNPGGEDISASIHLWKKGWRFAYQKDAIVYHDFDTNFRSFLRTWYNYGYGCSIVLHRELNMDELYPNPSNMPSYENYWPGYLMVPPTTGIRSGIRDIKYQLNKCSQQNLPLKNTIEIVFLTICQRLSHLFGWKKGKKQVSKKQ
ncbi:MAG TPA: glycosyltransferase [Candidatus Hydrogenedens sp.]|nr:glycosyltransferase [Candidatus Hydrogenedens sp.]HOL20803.1 glycosyltransferase [Candidatus Hydrogenedens sp.]HPP57964.1 glycosyltransferase [Candidatus Hydrogenedens sp.]